MNCWMPLLLWMPSILSLFYIAKTKPKLIYYIYSSTSLRSIEWIGFIKFNFFSVLTSKISDQQTSKHLMKWCWQYFLKSVKILLVFKPSSYSTRKRSIFLIFWIATLAIRISVMFGFDRKNLPIFSSRLISSFSSTYWHRFQIGILLMQPIGIVLANLCYLQMFEVFIVQCFNKPLSISLFRPIASIYKLLMLFNWLVIICSDVESKWTFVWSFIDFKLEQHLDTIKWATVSISIESLQIIIFEMNLPKFLNCDSSHW